jgi:uncharacterized membrane protein (DUF4010 family)
METTFQQLGIALLMGLLVGLQREHAASPLAGLRTFPLITILGSVCALLDQKMHWPGVAVAVGFAGGITLVAVGTFTRFLAEETDRGLTTEFAILLMYGVGAYVVLGEMLIAVAVGAGVAVLLQFKPELHGIAARLGDEDLRAIMQFALITCIVLPVLPKKAYGPYAVFNPFQIWLMVVLIVGISLGGYIVYKFFGARAGTLVSGILGGLISSTATTASYARRNVVAPENSPLDALVIVIASSMVYARVLTEIAVVAPGFLPHAAAPIGVMALVSIASAFVWTWRSGHRTTELPEQGNPTRLGSAVLFGGVYALLLFALAVVKDQLGSGGLYAVAALSGLTDMDAITLSTAQMTSQVNGDKSAGIDYVTGWQLIVVAAISNLVFKAGIVAILGSRRLMHYILGLFALPALAGALMLLLWSDPF